MTNPTVADFKAFFVRDFPYGSTTAAVMDADITRALLEAGANFNSALWSTQAEYSMAYLYVAAHYLVIDLRASSQGIAGTYSWLTSSKGVGSVNESYSIPQSILDSPVFSMFSKTAYGAKYLSLALPRIVGNVISVTGGTQA